MRISEVATLLGLGTKEVISEVEAQREALTAQGFKIAKKLTASSGVDDDAVRHLMAAVDARRREAQKESQEVEKARLREEEEKRRAEESAKRAAIEAQQRRAAEEARRRADEALERRTRELAKLPPIAPPAGPPPISPAPTSSPRAAAPPPIAVPPPAAAPAAPASAAPAPQAPQAAQPPAAAAPAAPPQAAAPAAPAAPPAQPPTAAAPPTIQSAPGPFSAGTPRRPPAPAADRRPEAPADRRDNRQSREGAPPRRDDNRPGRPSDRPARGASAPSAAGLADFVNQGLQPSVQDDHKARRRTDDRGKERRRPDEPAKAPRKKGVGDTTRRPSFRPTQIFEGEVVSATRRPSARPEKGRRKGSGGQRGPSQPQRPKVVRLAGDFTVGQFAEKIGVDPSDVIKRLFLMGEMLTMNQILDPDIAELLAAEYEIEVSIEREGDEYDIAKYLDIEDPAENLMPRPPVVTVMGHVDHGKTTLLDHIRKANVVDQEFGGITQHIGAYYVKTDKGDIVFLDTPGHEAFTAMRARGANATDLVVLVVAANDGVKPQTVEAISHAKAAGVPIIVAVNKIDVDGANPTRVRQELMRYELLDEKLGGDVIMVDVSAKRGDNMKELLEMVALQAEVLDLKANADRPAIGTIVESHMDPARGAIATVLVESGTLRVGDVFVCGTEYGRVRAMRDDKDQSLEEAGPARPVEILGLNGSPSAGEKFVVVPDESEAREIAEIRAFRRKNRSVRSKAHVTLENLAEHVAAEGEAKNLNLIIKADVQGSVEAISASLFKIKSDKVHIQILHSAVGPIGESDVQLADASDAIIIGFNVRPDPASRDLAAREGVEIRLYNLIYDLLEEIEKAMIGMLEPVFEEVDQSRCKVLQVFRVSKIGSIAGCFVEEGTVGRDHRARVVRGGTVIWTGKVKSLRRVKDDVKEVQSGLECGILLENYNDVKEDDIIETFTMKELTPSLVTAGAVEEG